MQKNKRNSKLTAASFLFFGFISFSHYLSGNPAPNDNLIQENPTFQVAPIFSDGAVLQRDKPIPIWGKSIPGDKITVGLKDQEKTASTDELGFWRVDLDPMEASREPLQLKISSQLTGTSVSAESVLIGDVWFCFGQSNMHWPVMNALNAKEEMQTADFPLIRGFRCPLVSSDRPEFTIKANWVKASPAQELKDSSIRGWSAVAYQFGKALHKQTEVPVGLIMSSYGGTMIESWMSQDALLLSGIKESVQKSWEQHLQKIPDLTRHWEIDLAKWKQEAEAASAKGEKPARREPRPPEGLGSRRQPSSLYNAMVHPFIPAAIRGFIWYQGESNAQRPEAYAKLFPAMITSLREEFGQGNLPFYFVQLANYEAKDETLRQWAFFREAQLSGLKLPNTAMAVTIDVGDATDIHPKDKGPVGDRLARQALHHEYSHPQIVAEGPKFEKATPRDGKMVVQFHGNPPLFLRSEGNRAFELAGEDKIFFPAKAEIEGSKLLLSAPNVTSPIAVRYAWWNNPDAVLFGPNDLPAAPFRSDQWSDTNSSGNP